MRALNISRRALAWLSLWHLCLLAGCKKETPIPQHSVSGRVFFDGKAVPKGDVVFVPDAAKGNTHLQFGVGKLEPDGSYKAMTIQTEGVKPGWYKVMILATENEPQESLAWVPIWIVPVKYTKPETTDLSVEVIANPAAGAYDFTLVDSEK